MRVLVEGLPPDGATARAATGNAWTLADWRIADVVDLLGRLVIDFENVHRPEKAPTLPYPDKVWRPGAPSAKAKAKAKAKAERQAREGYEDIVSKVAPGRL